MQNVALTFWNAAAAGMQNATKCRMHGVQVGASPRQPASMHACAQSAYRASTAVEEVIKLGNPGGKYQRSETGSRRATGAAWRAVGADITGCCSHLCAVWEGVEPGCRRVVGIFFVLFGVSRCC